MQIHELKVKAKKDRKRVGRGGKRGTFSGKGMKGQKARSGGNVDPLFEGGRTSLVDKLKKVRGFKAITSKKNIVTLDMIENNFENGDTVSAKALLEKGIIRKSKLSKGVKILGTGTITKKVSTDKDVLVSTSAAKAIEGAGGKIGYVQKTVVKKMERRLAKKVVKKKPVKKAKKK